MRLLAGYIWRTKVNRTAHHLVSRRHFGPAIKTHLVLRNVTLGFKLDMNSGVCVNIHLLSIWMRREGGYTTSVFDKSGMRTGCATRHLLNRLSFCLSAFCSTRHPSFVRLYIIQETT